MTFCKASKCPVPPKLTASGSDDKTEILRKYVPPTAPWTELEALFHELPPLTSTDFPTLREEFQDQQNSAKEKTPPDFALADAITKGMKSIDALILEESHPKAVLKLMSNSLSDRDAHRTLLAESEIGLEAVEVTRQRHYDLITGAERHTADLLKFAMNLQLPPQLTELGAATFPEMKRKMEQIRKVDPTKLVEAGCTFSPTATYPLMKLKSQGVITQVKLPADLHKKCSLTLQTTSDGGVKVVVSLTGKQARSLRRFEIAKDSVAELKRASAGSEVPLDGGFLTCSAPHLHRLLQKLSSG
jgi:hypothetical protein